MNAREKIGALEFDFHGLRYNAACELVEAGCEDDLIAAGHGTKSGYGFALHKEGSTENPGDACTTETSGT